MAFLLFGDDIEEILPDISIQDLRIRFEKLGIQSKKSTQLARFLIEPPG
jgi:hypothetical protein